MIKWDGRVDEFTGAERDALREAAAAIRRVGLLHDHPVVFEGGQQYGDMDAADVAAKLEKIAGII